MMERCTAEEVQQVSELLPAEKQFLYILLPQRLSSLKEE
jgi:hypothetical protein